MPYIPPSTPKFSTATASEATRSMPQTTQPCASSQVVGCGATSAGAIINGGLGVDTFTPGTGYYGGKHYAASAQDYQNGFNAFGSCANHAGLACRVTVNYNINIGQGFEANGDLLWTDTYSSVEQVKAVELNGNVMTGVNSYFCELKAGLGSTTFYDGTAGDRIIWSLAGATGLLDGNGLDVAYAGQGDDEFYWSNSTGGKGVSNFGETIYRFNIAQGDDLNLSEFATVGFAGVRRGFAGANDLVNWVNVSLTGTGDTVVQFDKSGSGNFTQNAVTLKNDSLFADFGVTDHCSIGVQQVVQDMYSTGHLVLSHTH
jgi:hypothetical protein